MKSLLDKIYLQMMKLLLDKIRQKRFWVFIIGSGIIGVLSIVGLQHTTDLVFALIYACWLFFIILCFIGSIILLMTLAIRMMIIFKIKSTLLELSLYGVAASGFILLTVWTIGNSICRKEIDASMKNAYIIIDALEKYKNEKGKYPEELKELVPHYLSEIPKAKTKRPFFKYMDFDYYSVKNNYFLKFNTPNGGVYEYNLNTKDWEYVED